MNIIYGPRPEKRSAADGHFAARIIRRAIAELKLGRTEFSLNMFESALGALGHPAEHDQVGVVHSIDGWMVSIYREVSTGLFGWEGSLIGIYSIGEWDMEASRGGFSSDEEALVDAKRALRGLRNCSSQKSG